MSDEMDTKLRELTYRLIEMSPQAPPFPEETMVKLDTRPAPAPHRRSSPLVWVAATAIVALVVVGLPLLLLGRGTEGTPPATTGPAPSVTTPTTTPPTEGVTLEFAVYLLSNELETSIGDPALVPVRMTQTVTEPVDDQLTQTLTAALQSLLVAPPAGYSTAIPEGIESVEVAVDGGVATVGFPPAFESGGGSAAMFGRLAQVVFTATQFDGVDSVLFEIDGVPVDVFSGEGIVLDGPQTRADYYDDAQAIYVDAPVVGSTVSSPITISGSANVFEATLGYEITTADGTVLADGFTTATCGTGCWGDYSADVPYVLADDTDGFVTVFTNSAQDGSRINVISYPVTLQAAASSDGAPVDPAVPASDAEAAVVQTLIDFASDPGAEALAAIPLASEVGLGLGPNLVRTVPAAALESSAAWVMDLDANSWRARSGTESVLDLLAQDRPRRIVTGDHLHCASPPVPAPAGLEAVRRISVQPTDVTSCLEWYTVDLFVDGDGQIVAITLDLYEP